MSKAEVFIRHDAVQTRCLQQAGLVGCALARIQIPADDLRRLKGCAAHFDNEVSGERASAAFLSVQLLAKHGLTWSEMIGATQAPEPPPPLQHQAEPEDWRAVLAAAMRSPARLTPWEREFCQDLSARPPPALSARQGTLLEQIARGLRGAGR